MSISLTNASLGHVLGVLADRVGVRLFFTSEYVPVNTRVSVVADGEPFCRVLEDLLKPYRLSAAVHRSSRQIVIVDDRSEAIAEREEIERRAGEIVGTVRDAESGLRLPGVNLVSAEDGLGATTTDRDGNFAFREVEAGYYVLTATFVGYRDLELDTIRVDAGSRWVVDVRMHRSTIELDQILILAYNPNIMRDVSANLIVWRPEDFANVPVSRIEDLILLNAGVEPGLRVRGSDVDQMSLIVDGISMRMGRDNVPFSGVSYTSIAEIQVQTGGFSAEYGNVRSGLVNVVTRQGPRDHYTADAIVRYSPPAPRHFGISPSHADAYYMRPFLDPDVAFVGTRSAESLWDVYLQRQYPEFVGWNAVARRYEGMTPEQLQKVFLHHHRKNLTPVVPDYELDMSIGGPVAGIGASLGNLRFFGSYREDQKAYIIPQSRDAYRNQLGQLKLTSDVTRGIQLNLHGIYSIENGVNADNDQGDARMFTGETPRYPWDTRDNLLSSYLGGSGRHGTTYGTVFSSIVWNPMDVRHLLLSADLTLAASSSTYYRMRVQRFQTNYSTYPPPERSSSPVTTVGSMELDEAPFGWTNRNDFGVTGERLSGHWGRARDSSEVTTWAAKLSVHRRISPYNLAKAGIDFIYNDLRMNRGTVDEWFINQALPYYVWSQKPLQGAVYVENRFDVQNMIANIGVRLDYLQPATRWYSIDQYDEILSRHIGIQGLNLVYELKPVRRQVALSPRLGVSLPINENSKFYFNYGHFRQILNPTSLFELRSIGRGRIDRVGNPNHPMPQTIAYELGYEQNVFRELLFRVTGYYKDISRQPRYVRYVSVDGTVDYETSLPYNYSDVRGFELIAGRNRGWLRGFVNYTYLVVKRGNFGVGMYYENAVEQAEHLRQTRDHYQDRLIPEPFARANVAIVTPERFGPTVLGRNLFGDLSLNLLGEWRAGEIFTWSGGDPIPGLENNVQYRDYYNLDLRLSKSIHTMVGQAQIFMDVTNVLNIRHLYLGSAFAGSEDFEYYMRSLHLPEDTFEDVPVVPYAFIPGTDRPGDYRKPGVEFVPIEIVSDLPIRGHEGPTTVLYFVQGSGEYVLWVDGDWQPAEAAFVNDVLKSKAYIEMPAHHASFGFLNPRRAIFGIRVSL